MTQRYQDGSIITFTYDLGDRIVQISDSTGSSTSWTFDDFDRIISKAGSQGTVGYTYDKSNRRTSMTVAGQPPVLYTHDAANRLKSIIQGTLAVQFEHDGVGRRSSISMPNGIVESYSYDSASRVLGIQYTKGMTLLGTLSYAYDAAGNTVRKSGTFADVALPASRTGQTYDAANRLVQGQGITLTYDSNGNLLADGASAYVWDTRNQLSSVTTSASSASFTYDGLGFRTQRVIGGATTGYVYDGYSIVQESNGAGTSQILAGLTTDEEFARTDVNTQVLIQDRIGSTLALVDQNGSTTTQYKYEPFGATAFTGAISKNSCEFTARENDGNGLYYFRSRYYDPVNQRFLSEDYSGFAGGINLYNYLGNNPLASTDPYGYRLPWNHQECLATAIAIEGLKAEVERRISEYFQNERVLPDQPQFPGQPARYHRQGHRRIIQELLERLEQKVNRYNQRCDQPPAPRIPVTVPVLTPEQQLELYRAVSIAAILAAAAALLRWVPILLF